MLIHSQLSEPMNKQLKHKKKGIYKKKRLTTVSYNAQHTLTSKDKIMCVSVLVLKIDRLPRRHFSSS